MILNAILVPGFMILGVLGLQLVMLLIYLYRLPLLKCEKMIQENSLTFYKAFSKIKHKKKRHAIYAVYAFCRYADDLADEYQDVEGLKQLENDLTKFKHGEVVKDFKFIALKRYAKSFYGKDYDYQPFYDMIEGQKMDLAFKDIKTLESLLNYCYHVAGTVGLMLIPILAPDQKDKLKKFAIDLGYAMQITNILRDVGEDFRRGRMYVPEDLLREANLKKEDIAHGNINIEFINLFERLASMAEAYFEQALRDIHLFPSDSKDPLALSIILYRAIIDSCRASGYDVFSQKNFVSDEKKNELIKAYFEQSKGVIL